LLADKSLMLDSGQCWMLNHPYGALFLPKNPPF
jgi:hypothetical protein